MQAFVTGATGFLGQNLSDVLLERGWAVTALVRAPSAAAHLARRGVRLAEGDLADAASVARALPEDVDAFFHVAGDVSMWAPDRQRQWAVNVDGTQACVDAARARRAKRFVLTSTAGVWGLHDAPFDEGTTRSGAVARIPYLASKAEGERRVLDSGLDAVVLNPGHIVGAYDRTGWSNTLELVREGKLAASPPGRGTFCHARRVAEAHESAARLGRAGERYLLGGADAAYAEVTALCARLLGIATTPRTAPGFVLKTVARLADAGSRISRKPPPITPALATILCGTLTFRSDKAQRELGYAPSTLEAMFADALAWQTANARA
ncbi:NAD-dependent epimerase/dehydratase family protein [Polyangium aurulentum]|uniref:NAD-dependent epimerase/dehydratase family protein n=1 Tax=Polyangium aurulentum TaxID=2567896 RepID=UPI0010AEC95F|nr:NAD-dependent epimerase/dehydratase family protein [Polyangium aurulentum]UQA56976.1 NAD-dependent epimerase/dehydratase family protein [Polyangium aurulentum]